MNAVTKLSAIALRSKYSNTVQELFEKFGRTVSDLEEIGCIAILLDVNGEYETASVLLKPLDVVAVEKWGQNQNSDRIADNIYRITFDDALFFFSRYSYIKKSRIILVGCLLKNKEDFRNYTTVMQSRQMVAELGEALDEHGITIEMGDIGKDNTSNWATKGKNRAPRKGYYSSDKKHRQTG